MIVYDRVYVINLKRRPDRLHQFLLHYPKHVFGEITVFEAVDGKGMFLPSWYNAGNGAWGCYCSHNNILAECLNEGLSSVLIFEDDASFKESTADRVQQFHNALPDDAQWVYYGGQHLFLDVQKPTPINEHVLRPYNINRTHAYGLLGKDAIERVFDHLQTTDFPRGGHIDRHYGILHEQEVLNTYCPSQWIVSQAAGHSDIDGKDHGERMWTFLADRTYALGMGFCGMH